MLLDNAQKSLWVIRQCKVLGIKAIHASRQQIILELPYSESIIGEPTKGVVHGGAITTLLDSASGIAAFCASDDIGLCPTLDLRVDYMRAATPGEAIFAKAACFRLTQNIIFVSCEAYQENNIVAKGTASFMRMGQQSIDAFQHLLKIYEGMPKSLEHEKKHFMNFTMAKTHETREQLITQAIKDQQIEPFLKAIPYARFIEFDLHSDEKRRVFKLKQAEHNLGNPLLPAIHGGVIGGFMELAAGCHLILSQSTPTFPKVINFSLDYLRPAQLTETYASCEVSRQGGRVANVLIKSWQSSEDKPIALARAHFLLDENRSL